MLYRNFIITEDHPPIPTRAHDWNYRHEDYNGPEDQRWGTGSSLQDCKNAIDDMLWEPECEACQGTGRIETANQFNVDSGTKWKRSFVEKGILVECEHCNGKIS